MNGHLLSDADLSYFVREVRLQCSLTLLAYNRLTDRIQRNAGS